ncbi:MAG: alpha/beta fold hydrolase [Rhodanobacteraceae bacterium]
MEKFPLATKGRSSRLATADGLTLAVESRGPIGARPVLFAHGFGQSRRIWARPAAALARRGWRTVTFDARGHGDSDRLPDGAYRLEQFVADLLAVTASLGESPVMVGHSMGGLLAIIAAGEVRPEPFRAPFRALVLVDIAPRWEASGVQRILAFMRAHRDGFASPEEAAREVAAYAPGRARSGEELTQLLRRDDDGRWRWQWDPALLDTVAVEGQRHQQRLVEAARNIDVPVLLLSGGRSDVVSERTVEEFLHNVPAARHIELPEATHAVATDDHGAFTAASASFLESLDPAPSRVRESRDTGGRSAAGAAPPASSAVNGP